MLILKKINIFKLGMRTKNGRVRITSRLKILAAYELKK